MAHHPHSHHTGRRIFTVALYILALIGLVFTLVFFGVRFGWLNVRGSISSRNSYFNFVKNKETHNLDQSDLSAACQISVLGKYAPFTAVNIYRTLTHGADKELLDQMIRVASKRFENDSVFRANMAYCATNDGSTLDLPISAFAWADTDQWNLMKEVFTRDQDIIKRAATDAKISPRLILSGVIGEQFRFFNNRREVFKSYFEPLKILASLSNTSYGIAGLKPKTVVQIEENLKNPASLYYLGPEMENVITYPRDADVTATQFDRITDAKDPYYSYLYVGLFMKEVQAQWNNAGFNIDNRPEILATIYNLGFYYSVPKADPKAGGTVINIAGTDYTFGDVGYEFYYSGELSTIFPLEVQ